MAAHHLWPMARRTGPKRKKRRARDDGWRLPDALWAEMAEFLNRSGFHNADGGPWNAHSFQTSLARLRASTPDTAEERPGADVAGP